MFSTNSEKLTSFNTIGELNAFCSKNMLDSPVYILDQAEGPSHARKFTMKCVVSKFFDYGVGATKQQAKHVAANAMLNKLIVSLGNEMQAVVTDCQDSFNFIGELSTFCSERHLDSPVYTLDQEEGPPHAKKFTMKCVVSNFFDCGVAATKQQAKHAAAKALLNKLMDSLGEEIQAVVTDRPDSFNAIGELNTFCSERHLDSPVYTLEQEGPSHAKKFTMKCVVLNIFEYGIAATKQQAKHAAAEAALNKLRELFRDQLKTAVIRSNFPKAEAHSKAAVTYNASELHADLSVTMEGVSKEGQETVPFKISNSLGESLKELAIDGPDSFNAIGELSTFCSERQLDSPVYTLDQEEGPTHAKKFTMKCVVLNIFEYGIAATKQQAKHAAAEAALNKLRGLFRDKLKTAVIWSNFPKAEEHSKATVTYNASELNPGVDLSESVKCNSKEGQEIFSNYSTNPRKLASFDAVSKLLAVCSEKQLTPPVYTLDQEEGPSHAKKFTLKCVVANISAQGTAATKKQSKQAAACAMLDILSTYTGALTTVSNAVLIHPPLDILSSSATTQQLDLDKKAEEKIFELTKIKRRPCKARDISSQYRFILNLTEKSTTLHHMVLREQKFEDIEGKADILERIAKELGVQLVTSQLHINPPIWFTKFEVKPAVCCSAWDKNDSVERVLRTFLWYFQQ